MTTITTREAWLQAGAERMAPWFKAIGANEVPPIRVSCAKAIVAELGPYPHAALKPGTRIGKQGTRMLKLICPIHGYTLRTTRKWLEELGFPSCPCGAEMELS
jgi:hypothetical protein